jgi:hypothetical protein
VLTVRFQSGDEEGALWQVKQQLHLLRSLTAWNPRARFVIMIMGQVIDDHQQLMINALLKELWDMQVINVIVLVKLSKLSSNRLTKDISDTHIFTWFPFAPPSGHCGVLSRVVIIDVWLSDSHEFLLDKDLFEGKIPEDLGLCPLRLSIYHFPPFIIFPEEDSPTLPSMRGVEMDLFRYVTEAMNASVVLPPRREYKTESKMMNGVWTGPTGDLVYNRSDVALGAWCFTLEDSLILDSTNSYFSEHFTFFIPRAELYPRFLSVSRVFVLKVWLLIFIVMLLTAVLLHRVALEQFPKERKSYKHVTKCLLNVWSAILGVGIQKMPRSNPVRGIFFLWLVFCLAINTVFQTYITSYLVDPGYMYQIDSVDEVIESGLELYVIDFIYDLISDNLLRQVKSWRTCGTAEYCLMTAGRLSGIIMLSGKVFVEYKTNQEHGMMTYHESSTDLFHFHVVMAVRKGSPYLDRMNIIIRRLVEGGFVVKFFKDIIEKDNMKSLSGLDQYTSISVYHLQSAFVAMFVGMLLSLFLFFHELIKKQ